MAELSGLNQINYVLRATTNDPTLVNRLSVPTNSLFMTPLYTLLMLVPICWFFFVCGVIMYLLKREMIKLDQL